MAAVAPKVFPAPRGSALMSIPAMLLATEAKSIDPAIDIDPPAIEPPLPRLLKRNPREDLMLPDPILPIPFMKPNFFTITKKNYRLFLVVGKSLLFLVMVKLFDGEQAFWFHTIIARLAGTLRGSRH